MDVYEKVCELITRQLRADSDVVEEDVDIVEDLGADSLDVVEILMAIEDSFGVTIPEEDVIGIRTVRELSDYVETRID